MENATSTRQKALALKANDFERPYYGTTLRGASNTKAKKALRFTPRCLEWLAG
jgi:hypothetical protein